MTLQKTKPKRPSEAHRKRTGQHHRHNQRYVKTYWPYLPLIAIVAVGLVFNSVWSGKHSVLGYATNMSISTLLKDTNVQRNDNSEGSLTLNSQLSQAAQAKANDMAARDYWSHDTPDGRTPWSFITAAGYSYTSAGENLAYGFSNADYTITGWMNSPEHRANILNKNYQNVGFGIANSPNYQGSGPETIVVAMYATPATATVVASTPPTQTAPSPAQSAPSPAPASHSTPAPSAPVNNKVKPVVTQPTQKQSTTQSVAELPAQNVSRVQLLTAGNAPWSVFAISLICSVCIALFIIRHGLFWHRALVKGEVFVMHHPMLDVVIVSLVMVGFVLTRSSGIIR